MSRSVTCVLVVAFTFAMTGPVTVANAADQPDTVVVVVELDGTAAVEVFDSALARGLGLAEARRLANEAKDQANARADRVVNTLRAKNVHVEEFGRTCNALPTTMLRVSPAALNELSLLPDVRSVRGVGEPAEPQSTGDALWTGAR